MSDRNDEDPNDGDPSGSGLNGDGLHGSVLRGSDLAAATARSAQGPAFEVLAARARRRRRTAVVGSGLAIAAVTLGIVAVVGVTQPSAGPAVPGPTAHQPTTPLTTHVPITGPCPVVSRPWLPVGSGCLTAVRGDFDGDGTPDVFAMYAHPLKADGSAAAWHLRLVLAAGGIHDLDVPFPGDGANLGVLGAVDGNRDGHDDAFVLLHEGASDAFLGIFSLADGQLTQLRGPDGQPFEIDQGGSVQFGSGARCPAPGGLPELVTTGFGYSRGAWHWTRTSYRWQGSQLVRVGGQHGVTSAAQATTYRTFDCRGLTLGD